MNRRQLRLEEEARRRGSVPEELEGPGYRRNPDTRTDRGIRRPIFEGLRLKQIAPEKWLSFFGEWLTESKHSLRSLSLLRIGFAGAMLLTLITNYQDRHYLWGSGSQWLTPAVNGAGYPRIFSLFPKDDPQLFDIMFYTLIILSGAFLVGFATRVALPPLLVLWVSLEANNPLIINGGDVAIRIVLFFMLFANLSAHFSIDSLLSRLLGWWPFGPGARNNRLTPFSNAAHNIALVLGIIQLVAIYMVSGISKLSGAEWLDASALYYALSLDSFMPFPDLSDALKMITPFVWVGTWLAMWSQILFPVLIIWRRTRFLIISLLAIIQILIGLLLGIWAFSLVMIALGGLLITDSDWAKLKLVLTGKQVKKTPRRAAGQNPRRAAEQSPRRGAR